MLVFYKRVLVLAAAISLFSLGCSDETSSSEPQTTEPDQAPTGDADLPDMGRPDADGGPVEDAQDQRDVMDVQEPDPTPEAGDAEEMPDAAPEPDAPDPCEGFEVRQTEFGLLALSGVDIVAGGGSGHYLWTFEENKSGGILDENSGFYLAGLTSGVVDLVDVTDVECGQTIKVTIEVFDPVRIFPSALELSPGGRVCFQTRGGSAPHGSEPSPFVWELVQTGSGDAELEEGGCYTAGAFIGGQDIVEVTDTFTGQTATAQIAIVESPEELYSAVSHVALPAGQNSFTVSVEGGSGVFVGEVLDPDEVGVGYAEGQDSRHFVILAGPRAGSATLRVSDEIHEGSFMDVRVNVLGGVQYLHGLSGQQNDDSSVRGVGDINGDGFGDVLVGVAAGGLNGTVSGAAFLYLGGQRQEDDTLGLGPEPAQIFAGPHRSSALGRSITTGDYDGDGCTDLAFGVHGDNQVEFQGGEIQVWLGCSEGETLRESFFGRAEDNGLTSGPAPTRLWRRIAGIGRGDRFGYALTTGDFNGDGLDDLAVSANAAESPEVLNPNDTIINNIGRVQVYLNGDLGFGSLPSFTIDGLEVDEDLNLFGVANLEFGSRLAAGDVNGDGCDDLLVGNQRGANRAGMVSLYTSTAAEPDACLLATRPSIAIYPDAADTRPGPLGTQVGFGDFNGDCVPDLVFSGLSHADLENNGANDGSVNILFGDPDWHPDSLRRLSRLESEIILYGDRSDQMGSDFSIGDTNADGIIDLVVGARNGEHGDTEIDVGEVRIYRGLISAEGCGGDQGAPSHLEAPIHVVNETYRRGDLFGSTVGIVGDVDGDDINDIVIHSMKGPRGPIEDTRDHVGRVSWIRGGLDEPSFADVRALVMPVAVSDEQVGFAVEAAGDINADGYLDLLVGIPRYDSAIEQEWGYLIDPLTGTAYIHFGGPDGYRPQPDMRFADHLSHNGRDHFGYSMARAGDFNGDGFDDVAIGTPFEDTNAQRCTSCKLNDRDVNDTGVVFIYYGGPEFGGRFDGDPEDVPVNPSPDAVICGPADLNSARISFIIHGGFDLNNDDRDDIMMTDTTFSGGRGRVYYALGQAEGGDICLSQQENVLDEGLNSRDALGTSHGEGDFNDDGCEDLVVGSPFYDLNGRSDAGAVKIHIGWGGEGCPTDQVVVTLFGPITNENMGISLSVADLNGDGVEDLAIASEGAGPTNVGAVVVYDGVDLREVVSAADTDTVVDMASLTQLGVLLDPTLLNNQNFGVSMVPLGDINHDGFDDIIVGARYGNPSGIGRTGAAYLFYGSDQREDLEKVDVMVPGQDMAEGEFGWSMAGGLLSADEESPGVIIIGAPAAEEPGPSGGEVGAAFMGLVE